MRKSAGLTLAAALSALMIACQPATAQSECPTHAHVDHVEMSGNVRTTHCVCDEGYDSGNGACVRVTTMRAQTRAECVRAAGMRLKQDLASCKSPIADCLTKAGVRPKEAICAASSLVVALDPSKVTVIGAVIACGDKVYEMADICGPTWGQCQNAPLKTHQQAIDRCPAN
jgi:hypothetical protein